MPQLSQCSQPLANPKHHIPEKYADEKTSGLTVNVKKGNPIMFYHLFTIGILTVTFAAASGLIPAAFAQESKLNPITNPTLSELRSN